MPQVNQHGQPVGADLPPDWSAPTGIAPVVLTGRSVRVEPLEFARHGDDLWEALALDHSGAGWTYMFCGPFEDKQAFQAWMTATCTGPDPMYFALIDLQTGGAVGWAAYLRISAKDASVEVGSIRLSPLAQRRTLATEAMHLMMKQAFSLGFRRYEWKCDSLNAPSRRAAERLGFQFEGVFRQASFYRGRNRDTAWYAVTDADWPRLRQAHECWLDPANFDADGRQKTGLSAFVRRSGTEAR